MSKSRNVLPPRKFWSDLEVKFLTANYADSLTADIARELGRPARTVYSKARKLGLLKSPEAIAQTARERIADPSHPARATQFRKGLVPANKGLRRPGWHAGNMRATQFAKGDKPHTWRPVGSVRVNGDGRLGRKVNDLPGADHVRWHPVHRLVWEAAHGPVPPGHLVVFKPGRSTTNEAEITLDAVELISRAENLARNSVHNLPKALVLVIQTLGALNRQIHRQSTRQANGPLQARSKTP